MTIILHDGGDEIGFNWGTHKHKKASHTPDYPIQMDIAQLMRKAGGSDPILGMKPFKVGTMD